MWEVWGDPGSHRVLQSPMSPGTFSDLSLLAPGHSSTSSLLAPVLSSTCTLCLGDPIQSPVLSTRYRSTLHTTLSRGPQADLFLIFRFIYLNNHVTAPRDNPQVTQTYKTDSWFSPSCDSLSQSRIPDNGATELVPQEPTVLPPFISVMAAGSAGLQKYTRNANSPPHLLTSCVPGPTSEPPAPTFASASSVQEGGW